MVRKARSSGGGSGYGSLGRSYGYSSLPASDAGSTRSLSGRTYGSGPSFTRQYSDSGGGGGTGHYSTFDRPKTLDRSLSYASLSGSVTNLKDRFDRPSSSRDSYMSDVGSSRSYGSYDRSQRAPSVSRSTYGSYSRETSPVRSSSRSGRYDSKTYGGGGMDYGTTYTPTRPKSVAETSSSYTPSRTRSTDFNLTPFGRTRTSSISDTRSYDRQPSVDRSSRASVDRSIRASVDRQLPSSSSYTRQSSVTKDSGYASKPPKSSSVRKSKVESEESSESVSESEEQNELHRYLTSRGTDPMDTEKEREREKRRSIYRKEKKSISRTKIKRYPTKSIKSRWNKPTIADNSQQIDMDEAEKQARKERREKLASNSSKYGGGGMSFGTSYAPKYPSRSSQSSYTPPTRQSSYSGHSTKDEDVTSPRSRHSSQNEEEPRSPRTPTSPGQKEPDTPKQSSFRSSRARQLSCPAGSQEEAPPSPKPKQSSFVPKWRKKVEPDPVTDDETEVASLTPENLSLKDSIDKVRTWKRQLSKDPPDTPTSPETINLPEKTAPRSRVPRARLVKPQIQKSNSSTNVLGDDSDEEDVKNDHRVSQLNKQKQQRFNTPKKKPTWGQKSPSSPRKLCAGVPNFPTEDDSDSDEPFMLHVQGQKKAVKNRHEKPEQNDRCPSPYDNVQGKPPHLLKPQVDRLDRSPSPYDNMAAPKPSGLRPEGRRRGPKVVKKDKPSADDSSSDGRSISSMDTHTGSLHRKKLSKAQSMESLTTNSSLPDIVPESKRGHVFISKVQDIDSLLGFSDDDDEFLSDSDEEQEQPPKNQARKRVDMINKNMLSPPKPSKPAEPKSPLAKKKIIRKDLVLPSGKGITYLKDAHKGKSGEDKAYIGNWRNVDELLGDETGDNRVRVLGAGGSAGGGGGQKLTLHIPQRQPQPEAELLAGSSESLLDTPVPDTPDLPLAPLPTFAFNSPPSSAVSMDNLNFDYSAKQQQRAQKTMSVCNLNQIDGSKPASPSVDNVPTGNLIDISRSSPEPNTTPTNIGKAYPSDYSAMAIAEARTILKNHGKLTMKDLLLVCRKKRPMKPPWVEDEQDRRFTGYKDLREMLEDQGIDVKKVCM